jgi:hypothetical protein
MGYRSERVIEIIAEVDQRWAAYFHSSSRVAIVILTADRSQSPRNYRTCVLRYWTTNLPNCAGWNRL